MVGPYVGLGLVLWRQQTLEEQVSKFIASAHDVLQTATGNLAAVATERLSDTVAEDAQRN